MSAWRIHRDSHALPAERCFYCVPPGNSGRIFIAEYPADYKNRSHTRNLYNHREKKLLQETWKDEYRPLIIKKSKWKRDPSMAFLFLPIKEPQGFSKFTPKGWAKMPKKRQMGYFKTRY